MAPKCAVTEKTYTWHKENGKSMLVAWVNGGSWTNQWRSRYTAQKWATHKKSRHKRFKQQMANVSQVRLARVELNLLIHGLLHVPLLFSTDHSLCSGESMQGGRYKRMPCTGKPMNARGWLLLLIGHMHLLHQAAKGFPAVLNELNKPN